MKILVLSHMYPYPGNEMSGRFVHEQNRALKDRGCEVTVVSPKPWVPGAFKRFSKGPNKYDRLPKANILDGIPVYYPRKPTLPIKYFFSTAGKAMLYSIKGQIKKLHKEKSFEVIHAHVVYPDGYAAAYLAKELGIPLVTTIHGQDFQQTIYESSTLKQKVLFTLEKSTRIIAVSKKLEKIGKDLLKTHGDRDPEKLVTIPNGFNPKVINLEDSQKTKKTPGEGEEFILLSVGNLIKTKGNDLTLKALKALNNPDVKLRIMGAGPEKSPLMKEVEDLGLQNQVSFLGKGTHQQVMEEMANCDLFVLPSWKEGFGVVYIEAMAHGKPVIACKGEGIDGVVRHGENGFLVEPNSVEDLRQKLQEALNLKEHLSFLGQRAKEDMKAFTWEENAKKNMQIYQDVRKNEN